MKSSPSWLSVSLITLIFSSSSSMSSFVSFSSWSSLETTGTGQLNTSHTWYHLTVSPSLQLSVCSSSFWGVSSDWSKARTTKLSLASIWQIFYPPFLSSSPVFLLPAHCFPLMMKKWWIIGKSMKIFTFSWFLLSFLLWFCHNLLSWMELKIR